jgi:hypothetical protein
VRQRRALSANMSETPLPERALSPRMRNVPSGERGAEEPDRTDPRDGADEVTEWVAGVRPEAAAAQRLVYGRSHDRVASGNRSRRQLKFRSAPALAGGHPGPVFGVTD